MSRDHVTVYASPPVLGISPPVLDIAAIEPSDAPWATRLNAIAGWVLKNEGTDRWADLARAWLDVRSLFGPTAALRLLDLPELAVLVDVEEQ